MPNDPRCDDQRLIGDSRGRLMRSEGSAVRHLLGSLHTVAGGPVYVQTAIPVGDPAGPTESHLCSRSWGQSDTYGMDHDKLRDPYYLQPARRKSAPWLVKCPEAATGPTGVAARHAHGSEARYCVHAWAQIGVDAVTIRRASRYTEQRAASCTGAADLVTAHAAGRREPAIAALGKRVGAPAWRESPCLGPPGEYLETDSPRVLRCNGFPAEVNMTAGTTAGGQDFPPPAAMECPCTAREILFPESTSSQAS